MTKQSQSDRLYELLRSGRPVRTDEIMRVVYGGDHLGIARIGARIHDLKTKRKLDIKGWHDKDRPTLYWYQLTPSTPPGQLFTPKPVEKKPNVLDAFMKA